MKGPIVQLLQGMIHDSERDFHRPLTPHHISRRMRMPPQTAIEPLIGFKLPLKGLARSNPALGTCHRPIVFARLQKCRVSLRPRRIERFAAALSGGKVPTVLPPFQPGSAGALRRAPRDIAP